MQHPKLQTSIKFLFVFKSCFPDSVVNFVSVFPQKCTKFRHWPQAQAGTWRGRSGGIGLACIVAATEVGGICQLMCEEHDP